MTIDIQISEVYREEIDIALLQQAAECVLAAEHIEGDVTVLITDDETVARLNQEFLDKSGPTDVLSFPAIEEESDFVLPPEESAYPYLGDVIIALPYTKRQARRLGRPLNDELTLLVIHGVLHLLGYDHATPEEKSEMWRRQNAILNGLSIPPMDD